MTEEDALRAANAAYYRAFADRDLVAMSQIWAEEAISCVHPGWPALIGTQAVLASYRDIFRNPRQESLTFRDEQTLVCGDEARVFCIESVGASMLLATNSFRRVDGRWRLVHHQASPLAVPAQETKNKPSFH